MRHAVELDRAADEARIAAVSPAPQAIAEHHHGRTLKHLVVGLELSAVHGLNAQQRKEIGGHGRDRHTLRFRAASGDDTGCADDVAARCRGEALERLRTLLIITKVQRCDRRQRLVADTQIHPDVRELLRLRVRQGPEQDAVDRAENRDGQSNPKSQRKHRHHGKARSFSPGAQRKYQIAQDVGHGHSIVCRRAGPPPL